MKRLRDLVPWRHSSSKIPVKKQGGSLGFLQEEMNRVFDDFFSGAPSAPFLQGEGDGGFVPKIDVEEREGEIRVVAELPGLTEKDIKLTITDEALTLEGEKRSESERTEGESTYFESQYGSFRRVVPLGVEIDHDKVDASLKNGRLSIKLPKMEPSQTKSKQISVKAG